MRTKKQNKLVLLATLIAFSFVLPIRQTQAISIPGLGGGGGGGLGSLSPTAAFNQIMTTNPGAQLMDQGFKDLGVDKGEVLNSVDTMNVARQKKMAPQVFVSFSPVNPTDGETVTASATPTYFMNADPKNLYFTWYLQRGQCVTDSNDACDLDGNGAVDVNDYKIAAAKIIANGGWDWNRTPNPNPQNPDDLAPYASHTDDDGYEAPMGGSDQKEKPDHCYIHDWNTGNEYELDWCSHLFPEGENIPDELGNGDFGMAEEQYWHTDPNNNDTAGTGRPDEANTLGLGISEFKWNYQTGDKVGVVVEGISMEPTQYKDSSYKTMWAMPKNTCNVGDYLGDWEYENGTTSYCLAEDGTHVPYVEGEDCPIYSEETATAYINNAAGITDSDTAIPADDGSGGPLVASDWADAPAIRVDGTGPTEGGEVMGLSEYVYPNFSVSRADGATTHPDDAIIYGNTATETKLVTETVVIIEAQLKAEITTITETTTTVTDVMGNVISETTESGEPTIEEVTANVFDMSKDSMNECLLDNLLAPSDVQENGGKIKLSLSSIPQSPMNDPSGDNSDTLIVTAAAEGVNNENFLRYDWEVYGGDASSVMSDDWGAAFTKADLVDSTQTSGIGVKSLKFKLALPSSPQYIKVRAVATEYEQGTGGRVLRKGNSSVVIRLSSSEDKISAYNANATDSATIAVGDAICEPSDDPAEKEAYAICPVLKHQIIGLNYSGTADNFLWTVDGEPLSCKEGLFDGCNPSEQGSTAFFPILKELGSVYTVSLSAVNHNTGEKINLTRTFKVVTPSVKIVAPADGGAKPVLLGSYVGLDGTEYPDNSETSFQATPGSSAAFALEFYPKNMPLNYIDFGKTSWFVDGIDPLDPNPPIGSTPATVSADKITVSFTANKLAGDHYMVSLNTLYTPSNDIKNILNSNWGVGYDQFYEKSLSSSVDVEMVAALQGASADNSKDGLPKKILAAMFSGLPSYISFLFRIVLTSSLLLFGTWIILSFFPSPIVNKNENQ